MAPPLVLTGASSGIGNSLARHLSEEYHVIALARRMERMRDDFAGDPSITPYELDLEDVLRSMRVNVAAPTLLFQKLLPGMADADFGRIINVTSGAPLNCPTGAGAYSASKAALNTLTVTAASEWEDHDIKINLMSPGPCRTEMAPDGPLDPSACHPTVDYLLSLDEAGPTGRFFWLGYEVPLFPDLGDVQWMEGIGSDAMTRVLDREPYRPEA